MKLRLIVFGVASVSALLLQPALAMKPLSDIQMAEKSGSVPPLFPTGGKYYTGPCNAPITPTPCVLTPPYSAACGFLVPGQEEEEAYMDTIYPVAFCAGYPDAPNANPPHCNQFRSQVRWLERRKYTQGAENGAVPTCGGAGNPLASDTWQCGWAGDCRPPQNIMGRRHCRTMIPP